jgi:hypothetical protein
MYIGDLLSLLEQLRTQGLSVSQLEAIKAQCSLRLLQNRMKVENVYFFGKVLGVRSDYDVAFSTVVDAWLPSVRYCSQNYVIWFSLTETPTDWVFDFSGESEELGRDHSHGWDSRSVFVIRCLLLLLWTWHRPDGRGGSADPEN